MSRPDRKNAKLRKQREVRGWSREVAARKVHATAASLGQPAPSIDDKYFQRWEEEGRVPNKANAHLVCVAFDLSPDELGWPPDLIPWPPQTAGPAGAKSRAILEPEPPVERREFTKGILSIIGTLSLAGWQQLAGPDSDDRSVDDLEAILSGTGSIRPGRVGSDELDYLRQTAGAFERWDALSGGARWRKAVVGQLRSVVDLNGAANPPALQAELLDITAQLAQLAGWMSYDSRLYDSAQRYYVLAIETSEQTGNHVFAAKVMGDMAQLANGLGRHDEELRLLQTALGSLPSETPTAVRTELLGLEARAYASMGNVTHAERSIAACIELHHKAASVASQSGQPHYMTPAEVDGLAANAYIELALRSAAKSQARSYTTRAAMHAARAAANRRQPYQRSRALDAIRLAYVRSAEDEPDEAANVAVGALELAANVSSARVIARLVAIHRHLRPAAAGSPEFMQFDDGLRAYLGQRTSLTT